MNNECNDPKGLAELLKEWEKACYQCGNIVAYLFGDSRCADCTRLTPEEVVGVPHSG